MTIVEQCAAAATLRIDSPSGPSSANSRAAAFRAWSRSEGAFVSPATVVRGSSTRATLGPLAAGRLRLVNLGREGYNDRYAIASGRSRGKPSAYLGYPAVGVCRRRGRSASRRDVRWPRPGLGGPAAGHVPHPFRSGRGRAGRQRVHLRRVLLGSRWGGPPAADPRSRDHLYPRVLRLPRVRRTLFIRQVREQSRL